MPLNGGGMPGTPQALVQMRDSMNTAGSTRSASNTQLTDDDAVRVVVRIRPMNDNEKGREEACVLEAQAGAKSLQVRTSGRESMKQYAFSKWGWWWLFFWRGGVVGCWWTFLFWESIGGMWGIKGSWLTVCCCSCSYFVQTWSVVPPPRRNNFLTVVESVNCWIRR